MQPLAMPTHGRRDANLALKLLLMLLFCSSCSSQFRGGIIMVKHNYEIHGVCNTNICMNFRESNTVVRYYTTSVDLHKLIACVYIQTVCVYKINVYKLCIIATS